MVEERAGIKISWVANGVLPLNWAGFYVAQRLLSRG